MATRLAAFWCIAVLPPNALALSLLRFHGGRVLAAVHELFQPLRAEPNNEVVAMGDDRNSDTTAQFAPVSQRINVFRYVQLLELASPLPQPILGVLAVDSAGDRVDFDTSHEYVLLAGWWYSS